MGLRQCQKCNEMVDEAKAFCPGCGNAFETEEKRTEASKFDSADHTIQFGKTAYNLMLSDMGLNISKAPDPVEKRIEMIAPVATSATPLPVRPPENIAVEPKPASNAKWFIIGGAIIVLGFLLILTA